MRTARIENTNSQRPNKFKKIGTVAGMATSGAYIAKNSKDIFIAKGKEAAKELGYKTKFAGIFVPAAVSASIVITGTTIGRFLGNMIDKHNQKKVNTEKA